MQAFRWIAACVLIGISSSSFAGKVDGIVVSHYESLQRLSFQRDGVAFSQKLQDAGPVDLSFDALGRTFVLQLSPNDGLLSPEARRSLSSNIALYRGQIAGNRDSWTRLVVVDRVPRGLIWDGAEMFAIEAPADSVIDSTTAVIYRLADTFIAPGAMSCGDAALSVNGATTYRKLIGELGSALAQAPGAVSEINIGAIGDFEFTSAMGASADAAILTRLNNVDGIYSQELGVQINIPTIETFPAAGDPFSDSTDPVALLTELADYREVTPAQNSHGLTHLYTGRDLNGTTVGIAFSGALCQTRFGAGLSQGTSGATTDSLIAAHEIGHNFGAPHDGTLGSPCENEPQTFIMAPSVNGSTQFSACSIAEMQDDIVAAPCITPLPSVDMTIALSGQDPTVLLGNAATLNFDVSNNGTLQATNVGVDITLPGNASFLSAATPAGTCTNGAGSVNCAIGDVAGISSLTVVLTTTTTAVGTGMFNATVTSDVDDNPGNNQDAVQLTVDPAVDLVINAPAARQVTVDQSTTVTGTLENRSILDATGVTLGITLDSGLRADNASWSIGTCTVAAQQVDCQTSMFGAQSNSTLTIGVTGIATGARSYTITLSSNEAEAVPSNNSASGTVTVNSVSGGNNDGGGGVTGLGFLCILLAPALLARVRRDS